MKRSLKILFIVIANSLVFQSCKTDNKQVTADMIHFPPSGDEAIGEAPVMLFDSLTYDFGKISIGEKVTHRYHFENTGPSPLVISQVSPACGCTTPKDWPHEPIQPGASGHITIEFNSKGFPGKIDKSISVLTNCIPKVIEIKLKGEVIGVDTEEYKKPKIEMEMER